ncbi:Replication factor-A C terminal domain-containing protein [Forsythia ovata]|uniref:Replication factor-A C terminal domain-containing protein n=1 Tax=Forsythia ovata TaxID=205694 RepID=A0ABD1UZ11_9LAMI
MAVGKEKFKEDAKRTAAVPLSHTATYNSRGTDKGVLRSDLLPPTIMLTMWDSYVDREWMLIAENIANKPVIVASHLKVSSFNGITLSTKTNINFFINATFNEVAEYKAWADGNLDKLNEIIEEKPYLVLTPLKLFSSRGKSIYSNQENP